MTFSKILIATDFTKDGDLALASAFSLARALGASVHILHVVEDPLRCTACIEEHSYEVPRLRDALVNEAQQAMTKIVAAQTSVHVTTQVAVGHPVETIIRTAADTGSDLIVVGTHGRDVAGHALMGSVAERVVRLAGCAVLAVREVSVPCGISVGASHAAPAEAAPV
jgi:nucleotide-binding universal stress UspA family protein